MQTLRKKTSPLKYKNETTRFLGDGVSFKAKLIGILEVSEARGDRMCQEALSDLKMAIRAAGEHKQRITINIAIDGLRLRDEKTGDSLYHHPVHKISFIAQDMTDSRAFGYIFGSPDTGHRFFGIKTDKAASQVVIAMRDLFQVVFALKKKEIELAKQHLDKSRFTNSSLFSDSSVSSTKLQPVVPENTKNVVDKAGAIEAKADGTAVADLVDLELELNSLQQGLNQMERITPSDPFGSKDDPFGDSFINYNKPILPPPPPGRERSSRSSETSSLFSPRTPRTALDSSSDASLKSKKGFSRGLTGSQQDSTLDSWFSQSSGKSIFEEPPLVPEPTKDEKHEMTKQEILSQFDVFTELDPLELKNPPKKVLNDLVSQSQQQETYFNKTLSLTKTPSDFTADPFGEDPFVTEDPFAEADFSKSDPFETEFGFKHAPKPPEFEGFKFEGDKTLPKPLEKSMVCGTSPKNVQFSAHFDKFEYKQESKLMRLHENVSLDVSSESEGAPEPPPRPEASMLQIKPPPLPPKKSPAKPPEESHYDYMDVYQTAPNSLEMMKKLDPAPPIPLPARKAKFDSDFVPERPKKTFNQTDEDYLTPIAFEKKEPVLFPPPQKKKPQVTLASYLDSKPSVAPDNLTSLDGLDITLSQLTLSGLNELATKLNIPANQLSNMTLVQLTNFLSNFIKSSAAGEAEANSNTSQSFDADFAANFNNLNNSAETYDRYAVFRELMNEEIKQTKIDTEPEELKEEKKFDSNVNNIYENELKDKYAALREIVESELKLEAEVQDDNKNENEQNILNEQVDETAIINNENKLIEEEKPDLIEYKTEEVKSDVLKSPKSPVQKAIKSPVPIAITEIMQSNVRLNSGSLSDVVSGSSPEVDNTGSNSEKKAEETAGESWAIFDQAMPAKDKQPVQSEEGVSPWSSDSKEFGNGSPLEWQRGDSESGGDHWTRRRPRKDQEGWWDTSAEPEVQYYPSNRRSTDSYDDDNNYECYERPRRRKQTNYGHGGQTGGHSSSSRDVSPWEEEPRRDTRPGWAKHEKYRDRRHDSWDDEDDYEYEEERIPRFHRKWEMERERYEMANREHGDKWDDEWDERRHRRRREGDRDRWCCPDWETGEHEKPSGRYGAGRWPHAEGPPGMWRSRKHDERYYSRESQESPWEDEYSNEAEEMSSSHYLTAKRNWKRPSSASEMDRKTGEIRSRHYLAAGGSDGERDRRYKPGRRSRSRDSQYSDASYRHKTEAAPTPRGSHRGKQYSKQFENEFMDAKKPSDAAKLDHSNKKSATLATRKKTKESPKAEMNIVGTFPRKSASRATKSLFENDFVSAEESKPSARFNFENEFVSSEAESPTLVAKPKGVRHQSFEKPLDGDFTRDTYRQRSLKELKLSPRLQSNSKSKSLFEDDFSPSGKGELCKDNSISSIKEEADPKSKDTFSTNFEATNYRKKKLNKHRLSNNVQSDINIKKSESVNIFARENDPFDDDFFSENVSSHDDTQAENSPKPSDLKWTEDFEEFPVEDK